jgi:hypothetical protein
VTPLDADRYDTLLRKIRHRLFDAATEDRCAWQPLYEGSVEAVPEHVRDAFEFFFGEVLIPYLA